ncbi:hypothetical protein [Croceimicrobium hydrocarbonivorans]|uniref:Outer membrane protein beta-barrel domain-containing protein n=1 Tax=Croceimicrobium hydrocarbonivorans TaxID=2761580 RepID=A0A7H0VEY5_9FLAO|nr:hypothetical protein [Croceimicrobium hydrocarbonivorans]QNR24283.1 hypothetical protein H4K34_00150 [Croceimicrobium hydrocarbonivorans]
MKSIKILILLLGMSSLSFMLKAGNHDGIPHMGDGKFNKQSHWQFGAGYGPSFARFGAQIKRTMPLFKTGTWAAWGALGYNYGVSYGLGLDFYLVDQLYLGLNYGSVGGYSVISFSPRTFLEKEYHNATGAAITLNYDWFFAGHFAVGLGAGVGYAGELEYGNKPIFYQVNLGLKYAFELKR